MEFTVIKPKSAKYITKEQAEKIAHIKRQEDFLHAQLNTPPDMSLEDERKTYEELHSLYHLRQAVLFDAKEAYIASLNGDKGLILKDAKSMIEQIGLPFITNILKLSMASVAMKSHATVTEAFSSIFPIYAAAFLDEQLDAAKQADIDITDDINALLKARTDKVLKPYGGIELYISQLSQTDTMSEIQPILKDLPTFIKSESYKIPNNKIANSYIEIQDYLLEQDADGQQTMVFTRPAQVKVGKTEKNGEKQTVTSIISLSYQGDLPAKLAKIKPFDKTVLNAIASLYDAGNRIVTYNSIFKTMNGNTDKEPRNKQKQNVIDACWKLNAFMPTIDFSAELQAGYIDADALSKETRITTTGEKLKTLEIKDRLVNCREYRGITDKGRVIEGIEILTEPILLTYSKLKAHKQIITLPAGMLNIESLSITDDIVVIKEYLARELKQIQSGYRDSNTLLFETIFKECGLNGDNKTIAMRHRNNILAILNEWKDKGYVKAFTDSKGNSNGYELIGEHPIRGVKVRPCIKEPKEQ